MKDVTIKVFVRSFLFGCLVSICMPDTLLSIPVAAVGGYLIAILTVRGIL